MVVNYNYIFFLPIFSEQFNALNVEFLSCIVSLLLVAQAENVLELDSVTLLYDCDEFLGVLLSSRRPRYELKEVRREPQENVEVPTETQKYLKLLVAEQGIVVRELIFENARFQYAVVQGNDERPFTCAMGFLTELLAPRFQLSKRLQLAFKLLTDDVAELLVELLEVRVISLDHLRETHRLIVLA